MPLPPKELYTLAETAVRWNVPIEIVEDYLQTGKLQSSILLPRKTMLRYTLQPNYDDPLSHDVNVYDIDYDDPDSIRSRQGIFNIIYQDIAWNEQGQAELLEGDLCLTLPDDEGYFSFDETFILNRKDVLITLSELNRFEKEHGIVANASQLNSKEKIDEASRDIDFSVNSKEIKSLLKIIITLVRDHQHFKYNPNDKKSTAPAMIAKAAERLELQISDDTVRKWLYQASLLLSREDQEH